MSVLPGGSGGVLGRRGSDRKDGRGEHWTLNSNGRSSDLFHIAPACLILQIKSSSIKPMENIKEH